MTGGNRLSKRMIERERKKHGEKRNWEKKEEMSTDKRKREVG